MLFSLIGLISFTAYCFKPFNLLIYFTNWTLLIQTASILSTIKAVEYPGFSEDISWVALNHLLYSSSIIFNFITVSVYWTMIHHEIYATYKNHPMELSQQIIVHVLPAVCCVINSLLTNIVMTKTLIKPLITIFWTYSFINFL